MRREPSPKFQAWKGGFTYRGGPMDVRHVEAEFSLLHKEYSYMEWTWEGSASWNIPISSIRRRIGVRLVSFERVGPTLSL